MEPLLDESDSVDEDPSARWPSRSAAGLARPDSLAAVVAVEAGALEDHADGVEHLAQPAARTPGRRSASRRRSSARLLEGVAALGAGVLVGGHGVLRESTRGDGRWHSSSSTANGTAQCPRRDRPALTDRAESGRRVRCPAAPAVRRRAGCVGRWCVLLVRRLVGGVVAVRRPLPAGRRHDPGAGARPRGRGDPRRPRHPADLRRQQPTTCSTPRATCRRRTGSSRWTSAGTSPPGRLAELLGSDDRSRPTCSSARWAGAGSPSRSCDAALAGDPALPRGLQRRRQRLPRTAQSADRRCRWSTPCSASAASTTSPSSGRRSTRSPGSRRWRGTCAATCDDEIDARPALARPHARSRSPSSTRRYPLRPARADRVDRTCRRRRGRARPRRRPALGRAALNAPRSRQRPTRRSTPMPDLLGQRRRHRLQLAGSSPASTPPPASRCWPTTRTSGRRMPGVWYQMGLHCPTVDAGCPFDVSGLHLLRAARAWSSATTATSPGGSPTSTPTSPTSTSSRSPARPISTTGSRCRSTSATR